ncbi:hypothetical protein [Novosphingobium guangzhouense]|uniref:Uncharacterized protein n=1 Tax=Novosphingobium guangzhouense TaxID=1850347 RepID=A0A2K2G248_9SPHN|nr:hypothetical protein [Novosphingobium guangzhouense]PNU05058.1 hypothetical protein A8V01_04295 [Novosphingobium guangzhouense]
MPAVSSSACERAIPALTPVRIEISADLGSATSHSLDAFPIRLAEAIVIDGVEIVPAGAKGLGEVVHAKKAGGSGTPGELVLAARWIDACGQRLKLRSMNFSAAGAGAIGTVNVVNAVSAASMLPIGLIGFAISGRNVTYAKGTLAWAKIAGAVPSPSPATIQPTDLEKR